MYWLPYSSHTSHHLSQTPCLPWISYTTQKLMLDSCKMLQKQSEAFHTFLWHFFPSLRQNSIAYCSSKVSSRPDGSFEIHQLWQSGFSRVYSNSCCSWSFETEIIKISQSFHKMYSNKILNFQEFTTILNACTKEVWKLSEPPRKSHVKLHPLNSLSLSLYIYIYICVCACARACVCMCVYQVEMIVMFYFKVFIKNEIKLMPL